MMIHGMVVLDPIFKKQLRRLLTHLPPRRHTAPRRLPATKIRQHPVRLIQNIPLLLQRHIHGILMTIAMQPNLVARVADHGRLFRKRFERVAGDEPRRRDAVLLEQLEKSSGPERACQEAAADVGRGVFALVAAEPACHCVNVDAVADEDALLAHGAWLMKGVLVVVVALARMCSLLYAGKAVCVWRFAVGSSSVWEQYTVVYRNYDVHPELPGGIYTSSGYE